MTHGILDEVPKKYGLRAFGVAHPPFLPRWLWPDVGLQARPSAQLGRGGVDFGDEDEEGEDAEEARRRRAPTPNRRTRPSPAAPDDAEGLRATGPSAASGVDGRVKLQAVPCPRWRHVGGVRRRRARRANAAAAGDCATRRRPGGRASGRRGAVAGPAVTWRSRLQL